VALPDAVGLNDTLNLALCPAASVKGRLRPLMLNPAPVNGARVTVILDNPLFVRVTVWDWLAPGCVPANVTLLGETLKLPVAVCCVVVVVVEVV
jgi:hypothetical protein